MKKLASKLTGIWWIIEAGCPRSRDSDC